jgi:tetratricopeptide (TPR) repeat protein
MKVNCKMLMVAALLAALVVPAAWAQGQSQGQGQQPPKPPTPPPAGQAPATPPATPAEATPPVNAQEEADYKLFFEIPRTENTKAIEAGEEFLKKYPESRYREGVYTRLVNSYLATDQVDKLYLAGEKAIELNPNNADVLAVVAFAVPRRLGPNDLDGPQKLIKSEKYAKQAIEIISQMTKPETLTEADFTRAKSEKLSMAHSGLAVVHYHRQRFADMATELEEATKLNPTPDPVDFFLLGVAYQQTKRFTDAVAAYEKCSEGGAMADRCKASAATARKQAAAVPKQ